MKINNVSLKERQNVRDFSYIVVGDNYKIKDNTILRSNNINCFIKEDIDYLVNKYDIKTIIDLRNKNEVLNNPCTLNKIKYYNIPLFESKKKITVSSNKQKVSVVPNIYETYLDMIRTKTAKKQLKKILKIIMNSNNHCVLFHCSFGKDRTGLISLLVLSMLGVSIDDIKKDYMYSNVFLEPIADSKYNYYLEKSRNVEYAQQMKDLFLVKEEYIDYVIDYMNEKRGSIINYIVYEIGISEKKINIFKNNILKIDK